jgi:hypothetical protein
VPPGASPQHTETHAVAVEVFVFGVTMTVAAVVSAAPASLSTPGAAPPSSSLTLNQGSGPIANMVLAGVATIVAVLPGATFASTEVAVDAGAPLTDTEHQPR